MIILKPHHFVALFRDLGSGADPARYTNGNDYKKAYDRVMADPALQVQSTVGVDFICKPCRYLGPDNKCTNTIGSGEQEEPLQEWAVRMDTRWMAALELKEGDVLSVKELCIRFRDKMGDLKQVYSEESDEDRQRRAAEISKGIARFLETSG